MTRLVGRWIRVSLCAVLAIVACSTNNGGSDSGAPDATGDVVVSDTTSDTNDGGGDAGLADVIEAGGAQHLYVGNDKVGGGVLRFTLPLTSSSVPDFIIPSSDIISVGLDPTGELVAAGDWHTNIFLFAAPLSDASAPAATFHNGDAGGSVGQLVFFADAGTLYAGSGGTSVNVFQAPYDDASAPASMITASGMTQTVGVAFDSSGNLHTSSNSNVYVFTPPYNGSPIVTTSLDGGATAYRKMVIIGSQLFVASVKTDYRVDVYDLPITASSAPAFAMRQGMNTPEGLAVDALGNLYVGNLGDATIKVYSPPFSNSSAPTTTLALVPDGGSFAVFSLAIGP